MATLTKWEYRQEIYQGPEHLNLMGIEGWELVCTVGTGGSFLIFKRPVLGKQAHAAAMADSSMAGASLGAGSSATSASSGAGGGSMAPKKKFKEMI